MAPLSRKAVTPLIRLALHEDGAANDLTSNVVLSVATRVDARILAKASGILAGGRIAAWTFQTQDPSLRCRLLRNDGARLTCGETVLTVRGNARSIFAAERVALNLLGHLSGVATLTRAFVKRTRPYRVRIYDTRKTLPGLRLLEKYAVRIGGGHNHRMGLHDAILIKTNHLKAAHGKSIIQDMVVRAKRIKPRTFVEIEVTNLRELKVALQAKPDAILLDNWPVKYIREAVAVRNSSPSTQHPAPLLEVSGGVTLANVRAIAKTGVDRISIGRLTHSAPSLDLSLQVVE